MADPRAAEVGWSDFEPLRNDDSWGWDEYTPLEIASVMDWDDSGALEALEFSRERKRARDLGLPCNVPSFKPDIFNDKIDWNTKPGKLSQEAAEAWAFIVDADKKANSRRKGGKYGRRKLDNAYARTASESREDVEEQTLPPTGWGQLPLSPEKQEQDSHPNPWRSGDKNGYNAWENRYNGWENRYNQPASSSWRNSGVKNSRYWQENSYKTGVWKPKTSNNFSNNWSQGSSRQQQGPRDEWNRQEYEHRRW